MKNVSGYLQRTLVLLAVLTSSGLRAQAPGTGAIAGEVSDPSGAVLPNAHVSVVCKQTGFNRMTTTTAEGSFRVPLLQPGDYSVVVDAAGFKQHSLPSVSVTVSETVEVKIKLELETVKSQVGVTAFTELAQTESSALGHATNEETIAALPLANRNYTQILALSPGVLVELPNASALGRNNQNVSANGARTTSNNFQFNGIDANNLAQNSASGYQSEVGVAVPAPDAIAQFKAQTGNYDAAYGRGAGANVDVIGKTGTNQFHGDAWEFFRNDVLNANDFFSKRNGQPRPVLKQNQFGFTFGGPIVRDKTFFFGSYQGTIQRNGDSNLSLVTAILPQLTNDRSAPTLGAQFCPANYPTNPGYLTAAGGVQVGNQETMGDIVGSQ